MEVDEHHASVWDERRHKLSFGAGDLARIAVAEARLALSSAGSADIVMVGYPGTPTCWLPGESPVDVRSSSTRSSLLRTRSFPIAGSPSPGR